jgi:hypothetical protein
VLSATETLFFLLHEFSLTLTFGDAVEQIGEIFKLREEKAEDPFI